MSRAPEYLQTPRTCSGRGLSTQSPANSRHHLLRQERHAFPFTRTVGTRSIHGCHQQPSEQSRSLSEYEKLFGDGLGRSIDHHAVDQLLDSDLVVGLLRIILHDGRIVDRQQDLSKILEAVEVAAFGIQHTVQRFGVAARDNDVAGGQASDSSGVKNVANRARDRSMWLRIAWLASLASRRRSAAMIWACSSFASFVARE